MAKQEQVQKERTEPEVGQEMAEEDALRQAQTSTKGAELTAEIDDLLDEIDSVLETNAEEFVNSYRQKGGE